MSTSVWHQKFFSISPRSSLVIHWPSNCGMIHFLHYCNSTVSVTLLQLMCFHMPQKEKDCPGPCPPNTCDYIVLHMLTWPLESSTINLLFLISSAVQTPDTAWQKHNRDATFHKPGNQWGFLFFYCHIGLCLTLFFSLSFTLAPLFDSKLVVFHSEIKCWGMLIVTADGLHCSVEKEIWSQLRMYNVLFVSANVRVLFYGSYLLPYNGKSN